MTERCKRGCLSLHSMMYGTTEGPEESVRGCTARKLSCMQACCDNISLQCSVTCSQADCALALLAGTVGTAEHSMPIGELGGKSACQRILGIIGLAKLSSTSVLAVITSAEKVLPFWRGAFGRGVMKCTVQGFGI